MEGNTSNDLAAPVQALKGFAERRHNQFLEMCEEVIEKGYYDSDDIKLIKNMREDCNNVTCQFYEGLAAIEAGYTREVRADKGDVGNLILNTKSQTASPIFSACNDSTGVCLQP